LQWHRQIVAELRAVQSTNLMIFQNAGPPTGTSSTASANLLRRSGQSASFLGCDESGREFHLVTSQLR
jgi:hypothetical protein